jgi:hypothetical protein
MIALEEKLTGEDILSSAMDQLNHTLNIQSKVLELP